MRIIYDQINKNTDAWFFLDVQNENGLPEDYLSLFKLAFHAFDWNFNIKLKLNLPSIHSFLDNKFNSIIIHVLIDCNVFYTSDSVHRWLVLALFVRNMMMNVHRLVRILKERSGTTLVYKPMHVYIYANNLVILFQHILCKAFPILKITFIFPFYGVRGGTR